MAIDKKVIKDAVDIVTLIGKYVKLKPEGPNMKGLCPFHNERSPSFTVSRKKGIYKCFGCGRSGDAIAFMMEFKRVDMPEAIRLLAAEFNILDPRAADEIPERIYSVPDPRPGALNGALGTYLQVQRGISLKTCQELGITESIEYMTEAKAEIPVFCFNYYKGKRLINIKMRGLNKEMQLVKNCELIPYNVNAIKDQAEACITEGEIDCATLHECGILPVVSVPNGTGGNIDWVTGFFDKKTKIILFTDDDEPGRKLQQKLIKRLGYHRCCVVHYPEGCKDINEVLVKHGPAAVRQVHAGAFPCPLPPPELTGASGDPLHPVTDPDDNMTFAVVLASGKISYRIWLPGILKWANSVGYYAMKYSNSEDSPVILIRQVENVLYPVTDKDIVLSFLAEVDLNYSDNEPERQCLYQYSTSLPKFLAGLQYFDKPILSDTREKSYVYFLNGVLVVTKENFTLIDYKNIDGFVWSNYIINHNYVESESDGDFSKFLVAVSVDADHYISNLSTLGYLLHSYKMRTLAKAVVIVEDVDDESEARGRSGKGLIAQFVELFKNTVQQDGRNYKTDDKFKMQRVDISTQVFYLNDPAPGLLLNQFYNMITDDFIVESKGKKSYVIPFKRSPKLLVTSNQLPALTSDSDKDRFVIMAIKKTFGSTEQISSRFPGVLFFDQDHWPELQFQAAFRLAIEALQVFLEHGLIPYTNPQMAANASKRLVGSTVPEYIKETLDQVLQIRQEQTTDNLFYDELRKIDFSPYKDMLSQAFHWHKEGTDVWITAFYRYCIIALKAKTSQIWFGRKFRFYLEHLNIPIDERRSNSTGQKIFVPFSKMGKVPDLEIPF